MNALLLWIPKVLLPILLLGGGSGAAWYLMNTTPEVERMEEARLAPAVQVISLQPGRFERSVEAYGTVQPAKEITLASEVAGRVIDVHPKMAPGGLVQEGELLLQIDPESYELDLAEAESALLEAQAAFEVEQGQQRVAEREWELYGKDLPKAELSRELALRMPQLRQAEARVASAQSAVDQAALALRRTEVRAPFDAIILDERVDPGQLLNSGDEVATLAGTSGFWILASVPSNRLGAILESVAAGNHTVAVYSDVDSAMGLPPREAQFLRHLGRVDPEGRMAQILVELGDPLHLGEAADNFPIPLNSFVRAVVPAGALDDVVRVPRIALRENNQVWVADANDQLAMRPIDLVWSQDADLAVRDTFEEGDRLIVSPLADVLPGMALRPQEAEETDANLEAFI